MTLMDLKTQLNSGIVDDSLLIFVCKENTFLANQYIEAICNLKKLSYTPVDSIFTQTTSLSLVMDFESDFRVMRTEVFSEFSDAYENITNTAVICDKVDSKIAKLVQDYIIDIPCLLDWQVKDYMKIHCTGITDYDIDWLYKAAKNDIYRITNELDKLSLFDEVDRSEILAKLRFSQESDLYNLGIFDLVDAIINCDKAILNEYIQHRKSCNFELFSLVNLTVSKAKNIFLITQNSGKNANDLEISEKQFYYIYNNCRNISANWLSKIIKVLSAIDLQVKSGQLDLSTDRQIDYILMKLVY